MDFDENNPPNEQEVKRFNGVSDNLQKLFGVLLVIIPLMIRLEGGWKDFLEANYVTIVASAIMLVIFYMGVILGNLLPHHIRNPVPSLILLIIGAIISILLSSLISLTLSWIVFVGWFIIFATIGYLQYTQNSN